MSIRQTSECSHMKVEDVVPSPGLCQPHACQHITSVYMPGFRAVAHTQLEHEELREVLAASEALSGLAVAQGAKPSLALRTTLQARRHPFCFSLYNAHRHGSQHDAGRGRVQMHPALHHNQSPCWMNYSSCDVALCANSGLYA